MKVKINVNLVFSLAAFSCLFRLGILLQFEKPVIHQLDLLLNLLTTMKYALILIVNSKMCSNLLNPIVIGLLYCLFYLI